MCCCCLLLLLLFVVAFNCYEISTILVQNFVAFFWISKAFQFFSGTRLPDLYMYDVFVGTELNNK